MPETRKKHDGNNNKTMREEASTFFLARFGFRALGFGPGRARATGRVLRVDFGLEYFQFGPTSGPLRSPPPLGGNKSQLLSIPIAQEESRIIAPFSFDSIIWNEGTYELELQYSGATITVKLASQTQTRTMDR